MKVHRLKLGFQGITDSELVELTSDIMMSFPSVPQFDTLKEDYQLFITAYDAFKEARKPPRLRSSVTAIAKNACKEKVILEMTLLGFGVQNKARNVLELLAKSGFPLSKESSPASKPSGMGGLTLKPGAEPGTIVITYSSLEGADDYVAQVSLDAKVWEWDHSSKNLRMEINGVPIDQMLYVRVAARNSAGLGDWSTIAMIRLA